jgi:hypothetical protein
MSPAGCARPQVKAKKLYNSNCPGRSLLSGDAWYQLQAFRSVFTWRGVLAPPRDGSMVHCLVTKGTANWGSAPTRVVVLWHAYGVGVLLGA